MEIVILTAKFLISATPVHLELLRRKKIRNEPVWGKAGKIIEYIVRDEKGESGSSIRYQTGGGEEKSSLVEEPRFSQKGFGTTSPEERKVCIVYLRVHIPVVPK